MFFVCFIYTISESLYTFIAEATDSTQNKCWSIYLKKNKVEIN